MKHLPDKLGMREEESQGERERQGTRSNVGRKRGDSHQDAQLSRKGLRDRHMAKDFTFFPATGAQSMGMSEYFACVPNEDQLLQASTIFQTVPRRNGHKAGVQ